MQFMKKLKVHINFLTEEMQNLMRNVFLSEEEKRKYLN